MSDQLIALLSFSICVMAIAMLVSIYRDVVIHARNYRIFEQDIGWKTIEIEFLKKQNKELMDVIRNTDSVKAYLLDPSGIHMLSQEQYKSLFDKDKE